MPQIPIGTIMPFAGDATNATVAAGLEAAGWLPCWGQMVAIADYPDLEAQIGKLYGGDDVTNIALPDLRGLFVRGAGVGSPIATVYGSLTAFPTSGSFTLDSGGAHTHSVPNVPGWDNSSDRCTGHSTYNWNSDSAQSGPASGPGGSQTHVHTIVSGGDAESRPINIYVDYIIKVRSVSA